MKPHLPLFLLHSLLSVFSASAVSTSYLADGVNETDLAHSERFYDVGKGYYWKFTGDRPYLGADALYKTTGRNFAFMGDLASRMSGTTLRVEAFDNLKNDGQTCGYQVPANQIQYWLSYYGMFYTGVEPLAYGLTYSNEYLEKLGGTQSLAVGMLFYDSWKDTANNLAIVGEWYFNGSRDSLLKDSSTVSGGWFADYFTPKQAVTYLTFTPSTEFSNFRELGVKSYTRELLKAFALEKSVDGTFSQTHPGQLSYLGLSIRGREEDKTAPGHALTCYGFATDEAGMLSALKVVNSDDRQFALLTLYVKESAEGYLSLYTDAACTELWIYSDASWSITGLEYINTPDELVELYELYNAASTPLVWSGAVQSWSPTSATTEALPTAATGWDVHLEGQSFHSYYSDSRIVCFDDAATSTEVHLGTSMSPAAMHLNNASNDYLFIGESGVHLQPESLSIGGTGTASFRNVLLSTHDLAWETYTLNIGQGARLTSNTADVGLHGVLELSGGSANIRDGLTFAQNAVLRVSTASTLTAPVTMLAGSEFDCVLSPAQTEQTLLSITGSLTLGNTVKLEISGSGLTEGTAYRICSVTEGSIATGNLFTEHGSLSFSDNTLWLTYREVPSYTWNGGNCRWSATEFGGAAHDTVHTDMEFNGGRGTITLVGKVSPHHLSLHGGTYIFTGSGASIDCEGEVNLDGNAALTLQIPVSAEGITLQDTATLTFYTGKNTTVSFLSAAEHTRVNFQGAVTYAVADIGVMAGDVSVGAGTTLEIRSAHDEYVEGPMLAVSENSVLQFVNSSVARGITVYDAVGSLEHFLGTIRIGKTGDAYGTTLELSHIPTSGHYDMAEGSALHVIAGGTLNSPMQGKGTLVLGAGSAFDIAVTEGSTSLSPTLAWDVQGTAVVGTSTERLATELARELTLSGDLSLYMKGGTTLHYDRMTLNGGSYTYYTASDLENVVQEIASLHVEKKGGSIARVLEPGSSYYSFAGITRIGSLTGEGNLTLSGEHFIQLNYYSVGGAGDAGFRGDLIVRDNALYQGDVYQMTAVELAAGEYGGAVRLSHEADDVHSRAVLGIKGDLTLRGLETDGKGANFVYSGELSSTDLDVTTLSPLSMIRLQEHTLTLDTERDFDFTGAVIGPLNLVKTGAGQQSFLGDMSAFSGSVSVGEGTLFFAQDTTVRSALVEQGGCLSAEHLTLLDHLEMTDGELVARSLTSSSASFRGHSVIHADSIATDGAWELLVGLDNLHAAAVELQKLSVAGTLTLGGLNVNYHPAEIASATYKLLALSSDWSEQLANLAIRSNGTLLTLGAAGSSPLYLQAAGDGFYDLMLEVTDGTAPLPRSEYVVLHWQPDSGVWSVGTGLLSGAWESEHENANFHAGDEVVFSSAANVSIQGRVVPSTIRVEHADGAVTFTGTSSGATIAGQGSLLKSGNGTLVINNANTYAGGTTISGGTLVLGHASALGTGEVSLAGGKLDTGNFAVTNRVTATGGTFCGERFAGQLTIDGDVSLGSTLRAATLNLNSGTLHGNVSSGNVSILNAAGGVLDGSLTLSGGTINFSVAPLEVSGSLLLDRNTRLGISGYTSVGTYTLIAAGSVSGSTDNLIYSHAIGRKGYDVSIIGSDLVLTISQLANELTWTDAKGTWTTSSVIGGTAYADGDTVNFRTAATVTISGAVAPGEVVVNSAANISFTADKKVVGSGISGEGSVTKSGAGMLTMNAGNSYSGGTVLNAGTLKATADDSFGTGVITIKGGTLDLGSKAVANDIVLSGSATLKGDTKYTGDVTVEGNATLLAKASYKGMTTIGEDSTLTLAEKVTMAGNVLVDGGRLVIRDAKGLTLAKNQTLTLNNGAVIGIVTIGAGSTFEWGNGGMSQAPVLSGGTLDLGGASVLTLTGAKAQVSFGGKAVDLPGKGIVRTDERLVINGGTVTVNALEGYTDAILLNDGATLKLATGKQTMDNTLIVKGNAAVVNGTTHYGDIIADGTLAKGTTIKLLTADQRVELNGDGAMLGTISGTGLVVVNGDVDVTAGKLSNTLIELNGTLRHTKGLTLAKGQTLTLGGGSVVGTLTIGAGAVLDMNGHTLTAAPVLKGGTADMGGAHTLTLTGNKGIISVEGQEYSLMAKSFVKSDAALTAAGGSVTINDFGGSTHEVNVTGGTLTLSTGKLASSNTIKVKGTAAVVNGATHSGNIIVDGTLAKGTNIKLLSSDQRVEFNGDGTMLGTIAGTGLVVVNGDVDVTAGKLSNAAIELNGTLRHTKGLMLAKGQTLTLGGGSVVGSLTIGAGAVLNMNGYTLTDAPVLKGGTADMGGTHTLTLTGSKGIISLEGQEYSLMAKSFVKSDAALTAAGGTVTINDFGGSTREVNVTGGTLTLSTGKLAASNAIKVKGNAAVVNGATHSGDISIENGTFAKGTNIKLIQATQRVSLNGEGALLGTIAGTGIVDVNASIDATAAKITATNINLNHGIYTNTKGLAVAKGQTLTLAGAALDLGPKGGLSTVAGSTLVVSSATTLTGNLTFGGGELVFEGGTLDVSGTLTLSKSMTVTGGGVITYGTLKPFKGDIAALFGGADVLLDTETCTLTFNGGVATRSRLAPAPLATAADTPVMAEASLDAAPAPLSLAPTTNPVADAMVQADWGILDANRAFANAVKTRHQHASLLDQGRGAAWVSAFGSSVRHGSQGAHHGSDGNIEGAAFGLEHAVSETGSLGLAVGRSKNRIAATGVTHLRQETAHVALYGQKQLAHGFTADAAAAYGDTETKLGSASWTQKSAALTARLTHAQQVPDATALAFRTFGGLAYEATDAGSIGSAHTGSVQNLRAELGAGITYTAGKAHLYAEAALTGDLIRHNPTADLDGTRTHGANPGRIGLRATVGGLYEFTDTWSGTASYGIDAESRSTAHTLNIGVSKSF